MDDKRFYTRILNHFGWTFDGTGWCSPDNKHYRKMPYYAIYIVSRQILHKYNITADTLLQQRGWEWTSKNKNIVAWRSNWQHPNGINEFRHTHVALTLSEMEAECACGEHI